MTKKELANVIHMYNLDCKDSARKGIDCQNCWRIAGQVMIYQGHRMVADGSKRRDEA
jgi:hypothetical protein